MIENEAFTFVHGSGTLTPAGVLRDIFRAAGYLADVYFAVHVARRDDQGGEAHVTET